jgi:formate-dependent nitrite reductase membrane component NrfD
MSAPERSRSKEGEQLMYAKQAAIVGDEFRPGFRLQRSWSWSMATSFFLGETGAGLFIVSLVLGYLPGLVLGLLLASVGKTAGHLMHMGQPIRAWRAIFKLKHSWTSRGLLAIILFTGCGIILVLDGAGLTFGLLPPALKFVVIAVAGVSAVVIMLYQGFAMSHSAAIGLWSSGLIPVLGLTYALLSGVSLLSVVGYGMLAARPHDDEMLQIVQVGLLVYAAVMLYSLVHAATFGPKGAHQSMSMLLHGPLAIWFIPLVVVIGLVVPILIISLEPKGLVPRLVATLALLVGYYAFRVLIFKAAVFDPIQSFLPQVARARPRRF